MATSKIFSLEGKGLKLDTAEDIEPHIKDLHEDEAVEEVRFQGNTLGIGASEHLAKILEDKKKLQVSTLLVTIARLDVDGSVGGELRGHIHIETAL